MAKKKRQPVKVPLKVRRKLARQKPLAPTVPETLTAKEQRFIEEYCVDMNASGAARRAGYSVKTCAEIGYELLRKPHIAAAIANWKARMAARAVMTREEIAQELDKLARVNLLDYFRIDASGQPHIDLTVMTRDQAAGLTELQVDDYVDGRGEDARDVKKVRIKTADKRASLMDLAKLEGHIKDKVEHSGVIGLSKAEVEAQYARLPTKVLRELEAIEAKRLAVLKEAGI